MRSRFFAAVLAAAIAGLTSIACAAEIKPFVRGSWKSLLESHEGKPLIVHFWGLTCGPCRTEMPSWGKLLAQNPVLPLVTINADLVPNEPAEAQEFLEKSGLARAESYIFEDGFVERLRYEIDPAWQGEIPVTLLIAADGTSTRIEGSADMTKVEAWLKGQGASSH